MRHQRSTPLRRLTTSLSIITGVALAASACATSMTNADSASSKSLTIATSFGIDDLDPIDTAYWGPEFGYVELLMRPERDGKPTPWVLKSLTNSDPLTWTLTLRDNVLFENGTALDPAALVALFNFSTKNNEGFAAAAPLDSVEATGPSTVTLKTKVPVPGMANVLASESNVPVFDVAAYEAHLASKAEPEALLDAGLYTGPYRMTSLDTQSADLVPVDNYWDGTPALESLTIKFVPEATSRVQAVQAGEADIALYMPTEVARALEGRKDAFYVTGEPGSSTFALQMRNAGPYADTRVRRAVYAAVDYRALAEDVLDGQASVATSVFGPTFDYAVDTQVTDVDEARDLLDQAGWTVGSDGVREKDGKPLTMRMFGYPEQPDSNTLSVALQSQLKEIGIDVKVTSSPDLTVTREGTDWDVAVVGASLLSFSLSPEDGLRSGLVTGGGQNYMKVSNADLDAAVSRLSKTFDDEKRVALLQEIQQIIHDHGLWAATVLRQPAVVTNAAWKGYVPPIANMWVDATTAPKS